MRTHDASDDTSTALCGALGASLAEIVAGLEAGAGFAVVTEEDLD